MGLFGDIGIGGLFFGWMRSFIFWGILAFVLIFIVFGYLIIRKRRKLIYPTIELTDLGKGKIGFRETKSGWFKTRKIWLYDYGGEEYLMTKDGRKIQGGSSEDFHDIRGKRGLIVYRKSDDPKILVPISKMWVENRKLVNSIAPADYRDASVQIIKQAQAETQSTLEKILPYIAIGLLALIFFISIILIVQMVKNSQAEASKLILQAGQQAEMCKQYLSELPSNAP